MSQDKQFLVSGALLECPYGTQKATLQGRESNASLQIGDELFLSTAATKKEQNIVSFGMCKYKEEEDVVCGAQMDLAEEWLNPVTASRMLTIQTESEAIHKDARLLCIYGRTYIRPVTTGQKELTETEKKFIRYMQEHFGFDEEVVLIMLKVIYAIDKEYPDETEQKKAWRFARLMGGFCYGNGGEDRLIEIRSKELFEEIGLEAEADTNWEENKGKQEDSIKEWNRTAGRSPFDSLFTYGEKEREEKEYLYFTENLGLSDDEYYKLRFHVMAQNEITSRPLRSFPTYMCEQIKGIEKQEIEVSEDGIKQKKIVEVEVSYTHLYKDAWIKLYNPKYQKTGGINNETIETDFLKEWTRLYYNYTNVTTEEAKRLKKDIGLFKDYTAIEEENNKRNIPYSLEPLYTDFSHQQIVIATITLDDGRSGLDTLAGVMDHLSNFGVTMIKNGLIGFVTQFRTSLAGWQGDIRLADGKMSIDDYKADLDAVNISAYIMDEDLNLVEATNLYYGILEEGGNSREIEFLQNIGRGNEENGLNRVISQDILVEKAMEVYGQIKAMIKKEKYDFTIGDKTSEEFINRLLEGIQ